MTVHLWQKHLGAAMPSLLRGATHAAVSQVGMALHTLGTLSAEGRATLSIMANPVMPHQQVMEPHLLQTASPKGVGHPPQGSPYMQHTMQVCLMACSFQSCSFNSASHSFPVSNVLTKAGWPNMVLKMTCYLSCCLRCQHVDLHMLDACCCLPVFMYSCITITARHVTMQGCKWYQLCLCEHTHTWFNSPCLQTVETEAECADAADQYGAGSRGQSSYGPNATYASGTNRQAPQVSTSVACHSDGSLCSRQPRYTDDQ